MIRISVDCIMAKNRRVEIALRQGFEGVHRYKPGKSKLLLVVFTNWYGDKSINQGNSCSEMLGTVLICSSKGLEE